MRKKIGFFSILIIVFVITACDQRGIKETEVKKRPYPGIGKVKKKLGNVEEASMVYKDSIIGFSAKTISLIQDQSKNKNVLYTPLNYYMTLAVLSQIAEDENQKRLLKILGMEDVDLEKLQVIKDYVELHGSKVVPGEVSIKNSLWLNKSTYCKNGGVYHVKKNFESDIFQVDFTKKKTQENMKKWIHSRAYLLSKEYIRDQQSDRKIGKNHYKRDMMLLHSFYFSNEWFVPFDEELVKKGKFTKGNGEKVNCNFMERQMDATVYEGGNFKAVGIPFKNGSKLLAILPNQEDMDVTEVMKDMGQVEKMIRTCGGVDKGVHDVTLKMPRFSLEKRCAFYNMTKELGIENMMNADQTSNIRQYARFSVNEKGCMTSVCTFMDETKEGVGTKEKVDMVFNRSFGVMLIKNEVPLLYGIINHPGK